MRIVFDNSRKRSSKQPKREAGRTVKSRVRRIVLGTANSGQNNADGEYPVNIILLCTKSHYSAAKERNHLLGWFCFLVDIGMRTKHTNQIIAL